MSATHMGATGDWLDSNTRYLMAAVGWVRARLLTIIPDPPRAPPSEERGFWGGPKPAAPSQPKRGHPDHKHAPAEAQRQAAEMERIAATSTPPPALLVLAERLGLTRFERSTLLLCAAVELDTGIAALCAAAQGDPTRTSPSFALTLSLFDDPTWDALSPERPLRHWRLLEISQPGAMPLTVSPLRADERIVNFLKGVTYVEDRLLPFVTPLPPPGEAPPSQRAVAAALVEAATADAGSGPPPLQLLGPDPASKQLVAALVCEMLGLRPYRLDWNLLPSAPAELESLVRLWQRETLLLPLALYLDAEAAEGAAAAVLDRLLARVGGVVFLATRELWPGGGGA